MVDSKSFLAIGAVLVRRKRQSWNKRAKTEHVCLKRESGHEEVT